MAAQAIIKYIRVSPQRARMVANLVRGKNTNEALAILQYSTNKGARIIHRLLKSAVSNAAGTEKVDVDTLFIKEIRVDSGPILKRFTARAQGRGARVNKRTSHIQVKLGER